MCLHPLVSAQPGISISAHFADLRDPRLERTKAHDLMTILVIAICASIAGANDWVAVAEFGRSRQAWFATFLDLPNGIPSHDTFWRVFRVLDPGQFQTCFLNWIGATSPLIGGQVIASDGKQLRRSHDKGLGRKAIYMVSAWATANHLVLGQRKVAEKSSEITAIPELSRALDLAGCLVTIDAILDNLVRPATLPRVGSEQFFPTVLRLQLSYYQPFAPNIEQKRGFLMRETIRRHKGARDYHIVLQGEDSHNL